MDDEGNGGYARVPEVEDLIKVCKALNENGVKYILIGGFAVILNGYVRGTKDIDFLVDDSRDNIKKIKKALGVLSDNAVASMREDEVKKYSVVRVADEVVIDLMAKACGITYDKAKEEIEYYEIDNLEIPVASRQLLIRLKNTVRPHDKNDVQF